MSTCLVGVFAVHKHLFLKFSASLYEQRWHEVTKFIRKVKPLLSILTATFDAKKFMEGDTGLKKFRQTDSDSAITPLTVAKVLRSTFFRAYFKMVEKVEVTSDRITGEMELCPCHATLSKQLSLYERSLLFRDHYGEGFGSCPLSAMNSSELAAGRLDRLAEEVWNTTETELLLDIGTPADQICLAPLSGIEMAKVFGDFAKMKSSILLMVSMKGGYFKQLPWYLADHPTLFALGYIYSYICILY
jgi:hypothetical protein